MKQPGAAPVAAPAPVMPAMPVPVMPKMPVWDPCLKKGPWGMCVGGMKQAGGGYQFGAAITPGLINNYGQEVVAGKPLIPDCVAAAKSDSLGFSGPKGLPGMSGGRRRRRQSGGRYGFVSADGAAASGPPSMGGLAPMSRIPCEAATPNPLNPRQGGGGAPPLTGMSLGGDNQAYYAPTAGYSNQASTWVGSTGAPSMIQTPYEAKSMNPACLKTGGGSTRRASKKSRRSSRRTRYMARGGGVKEDALKVLKDNKRNVEDFHASLIGRGGKNPTTLDGFTFKAVGHVNLSLMAKKEGANDDTYVEIHFMSDH